MQTYPLRDPLHPSAQVFIQACQAQSVQLTTAEIRAINVLVTKLINYNLWNKFRAIYPFVGRNQKTHSINLRNVYRHKINWFNRSQIRHDSLGVTNLGDGYGNTYFAPSWLSDNDIHVSVYSATYWFDANGYCPLIGSSTNQNSVPPRAGSAWIHAIHIRAPEPTFDSTGQYYVIAPIYTYSCSPTININNIFAGEDASDRFHFLAFGLIVGVNGKRCYVCGNPFGVTASQGVNFPNPINPKRRKDELEPQNDDIPLYTQFPFLIFSTGSFGSVSGGSSGKANIRFCTIGYGLSDSENKIFYDIVNEFQTILGRNVPCATADVVEQTITDSDFYHPTIQIQKVEKEIGFFYRAFYDSVKLNPDKEERYKQDILIPSMEITSCLRSGPRRVFLKDGASPSVEILNFQEN
jgi:hypothetical protein